MNKIMIVDDMPIFLEYLRGCIDWNSYGFEICCEAHDGKQALEMMEEYLPDVVLTDITMPYLNGLELSERILKDYPDTAVVLITGNNEFEYARKAVKIGVCDYIVKPFEKEELILSLLKLQDNMNKALENEEKEDSDLENELRSLIYAGGTAADKGLEKRLFGENAPEDQGAYLLALARFDAGKTAGETTGADMLEERMNWAKMIARMLGDKLEIDGSFRIFHDFENNIVTLMRFRTQAGEKEFKGYEFTDLIGIVKNQLGFDLTVALAEAKNFGKVKKAYEKALGAGGPGQLRDLRLDPDTGSHASIDAILQLNRDIETLSSEGASQTINGLWEAMQQVSRETGRTPAISDMNILASAISILMTNIINSGFSAEKIFGEGFTPEQYLAGSASPEEMKDRVIELYRKRIDFQKNRSASKSRDIALGAKTYIEEHYGRSDLAISDISESLCVNQTYLRKMFKDEMNMTLSEYITQIRMQEAKRLITSTDRKLTEISEEVGFTDVAYFSNVFKKYYGISPRNMGKE